MASPDRERLAKQLLRAQVGTGEAPLRRASKPTSAKPKIGIHGSQRPTRRHKHLHRLPSPTEEQLERREQGWNDRFARDTPSQPKRPARLHRANNETTDLHDQKERKIREERQQYGHGDAPKPQRLGGSRLVPIAPLLLPPKEPELASSKEEKLRFNVLKAIDARETLIYQLNALILCTPVQEAIVMAASRASSGNHPQIKPKATMALAPGMASSAQGSGSAMSNAREAMRLAQQLGADIQVSGIQVVEGIVEWMLEAGAKADKPPEFVWRGRNYFLKMQNDLDFAGPELYARGVELDCFTTANPLCIRPDQKLGRVLAAQSIIKEMVDMARSQMASDENLKKTGQDQPRKSARRANSHKLSSRSESADRSSGTEVKEGNHKQQHQVSADEMIVVSAPADDYEDDGFISARSEVAASPIPTISVDALRDAETEKELVNILDESFCEASPRESPKEPDSTLKLSNRSVKSSSREEYENSFDNEDGDESLQEENADDRADHVSVDRANTPPKSTDSKLDTNDEPPPPSAKTLSTEIVLSEEIEPENVDEQGAVWDRAAVLLQRFASAESTVSGTSLRDCIEWITSRRNDLHEAVEKASWAEVQMTLDGSLLRAYDSAWYHEEALESMVSCLNSEQDLVDVKVSEHLWDECIFLVDEVSGGLARTLERAITKISSNIAEINLLDVMEAAEKLLDDDDTRAALKWFGHAAKILVKLLSRRDIKTTLQGFSRLVHIFYPYLVNQRRDKLVHSWDRIEALFANKSGVRLEDLSFLLDSPGKILLLNVSCLRRISQELNEDEAVPKLTVVCDRGNLIESSTKAVAAKCLTGTSVDKQLPSYQIFPFFLSSFGEKVVDGVRVEEGEGKGPLKEWFTLIAAELIAKWSAIELSVAASDDFDPVLVNGNKLVVDRLDAWLKPGYKVEWRSPTDGTTVSRIVNKCDSSNGAYMLDRGGISNHSFNVSELRVFKPRTAYFEYIQASESYWLNEAIMDTAENRQVLEFVGWLLANGLVHQCALQLRLHQLLFKLLLDSERTVTLHDLKSLDPSLHAAIEQLQHMKPAEFASYLEFEGLSPLLSVDEYTAQTIGQKYGAQSSVAWQLREMRRGFQKVFSTQDIQTCSVSASDLADHLCGETHGSSDGDFQIGEVFRMSLDPDFASCEPLRQCFWDAVNGFEPSLKRKLVKFITGVDTLPQAGTEFLRIEMPFPALSPSECERTLHMLPQSHTCDNTLELPNYWRALCWKLKDEPDRPSERVEVELVALLREKLSLAAEYSSGYGLDGTKSSGNSLAGILPGSLATGATLDVQDSYESLDVPGLGGDSIEDAGESRTSTGAPQAGDPLETTDMRQSAEPDARGSASKGADEDAYEAEDWDVEEEELDG